jgi:hypothetical protein
MFCTDLNKCQCAQCRMSNRQPVARVPLPSSARHPTETLFLPLRPTGRSRRTATAATVRRPRLSERNHCSSRSGGAQPRRTVPYARSRALRTMRWFGVSQLRTSALTESAGADAVGAAATSAPARAQLCGPRCAAVLCAAALYAECSCADAHARPLSEAHAATPRCTARHGRRPRLPCRAVPRNSTRRQL